MTVGQAGDSRIASGFGQGNEFVALFKTDGNEVSGGGYGRQSASFVQSTESGNTDAIVNQAEIDFGSATANWGSINQVRIYNSASSSSATALVFTANITTRVVNSGDSFSIPVNGFQINIV